MFHINSVWLDQEHGPDLLTWPDLISQQTWVSSSSWWWRISDDGCLLTVVGVLVNGICEDFWRHVPLTLDVERWRHILPTAKSQNYMRFFFNFNDTLLILHHVWFMTVQSGSINNFSTQRFDHMMTRGSNRRGRGLNYIMGHKQVIGCFLFVRLLLLPSAKCNVTSPVVLTGNTMFKFQLVSAVCFLLAHISYVLMYSSITRATWQVETRSCRVLTCSGSGWRRVGFSPDGWVYGFSVNLNLFYVPQLALAVC